MARIWATGSDASAASAPAGGVLSTRAGAFRFRTGGPGSSDSRATCLGALEGASPLVICARGRSEVDDESDDELEAEEPEEVGLRFRRGRSGSSSLELEEEEEEDADLSERSEEELLVLEPEALSWRLTRSAWK